MTDRELMSIPEGPTGVWVEYADGTRYSDCPTVYVGTDEEGVALFELIPPRTEPPVSLGAETLPGMTGLSFPKLRPTS